MVTNTRKTDIIVGFNWLQKHNPSVNWKKTVDITFDCYPLECGMPSAGVEGEEREEDGKVEDGDWIFVTQIHPEEGREWISSTHTHSQRPAEEAQKEKWKKSMEEMVPVHYLKLFQEIFEKEKFDRLPECH